MSAERLIVMDKITDKFVRHFLAVIKTLPPTIGKYSVTKKSIERVQALIEDALAKGATLATDHPTSLYAGATMTRSVVRHLTPEMDLWDTESFGPCVGIIEVKDVDEAIRICNESFYGLSSSIFSRDRAAAISLAKRMEVGAVHINAATIHDEPTLPHGGIKDSGFGRFGGRWGVMEWVKTKTVMVHGVPL
jgi:acyl-CoA reductase-like NAD-dependent aldehyde dehydrogenase